LQVTAKITHLCDTNFRILCEHGHAVPAITANPGKEAHRQGNPIERQRKGGEGETKMRKLTILAALLALMLVAAAPAFADTAVGGDVDVSFRDASQTQAAAATQTNRGDADAGNLGSAAAIDQDLDLDQSQVNGGFGGVAAGDDIDVSWWDWWW
jgi:hypothetical protein